MKKELDIKLRMKAIYIYLMLHKNLSSNEIVNLYIEYLKLSVCLGTNNPVFNENLSRYIDTNCYCYALGLSYPQLFHYRYWEAETDDFWHNLGFISQSRYPNTVNEKLENLYRDLEVLNIKFYETDFYSQNQHGGYKIALYNAPYDFHLIRQNSDGLWSEKLGYSSYIIQMKEPRPINENYQLIKTLEIVKPSIK